MMRLAVFITLLNTTAAYSSTKNTGRTLSYNRPIKPIDEKHLEKYPFCGRMKTPSMEALGRVVNSDEPKDYYRWVLRITRDNLNTDGRMHRSRCSGSVVTER